jgi:TonB family protein
MKKLIILLLFLITSVVIFGQEQKQYKDEIQGVKITAPKFIGQVTLPTAKEEGVFGSLRDYLLKHIQYPDESKRWIQEGTEVVQFVITKEGRISDFNIVNSVSPEIDEEVLRVLKTTNRMWNPGMRNGEIVDMEREISIVFSLDENMQNTPNFFVYAKRNFDKANKKFFVDKSNKRALKYYNRAVKYIPNDKSLLVTRGMCRYELGDSKGACQDWIRVKSLGGFESEEYLKRFSDFEGYAQMIDIVKDES